MMVADYKEHQFSYTKNKFNFYPYLIGNFDEGCYMVIRFMDLHIPYSSSKVIYMTFPKKSKIIDIYDDVSSLIYYLDTEVIK
jgi:hypothetical protein